MERVTQKTKRQLVFSNPHSWNSHTESISLQCEKLLDETLKEEALNAKLYLQNTSQLSNLENAINQNINITQSAFTFPKLTIETLEQGIKYVQS